MKSLMKLLTAALALGVLVAAGVGAPVPASAQTKILVHIFSPPNFPNNSHGWDYLKENIERDTEGRVLFEYTPGAVAPPTRNWDNVTNGLVDAAYFGSPLEGNRLFLEELGRFPGNTPSAEAMGVAMWRTHQKFFEAANQFKGAKLLATYTYTGEQIFTIDRPINAIADLKGLRLRTGAGLARDIFADLGVAPMTVMTPEMFSVVSKGVVDGMTGSAALATVLKVDRFLKYSVNFPGSFISLVWTPILNLDKWESISADDQAIMGRYIGEPLTRNVSARWDEANEESTRKMIEAGVKFHDASPEFVAEVKKRTAKYTDEWLEKTAKIGVDGKAAMDYFHRQLKIVLAEKE